MVSMPRLASGLSPLAAGLLDVAMLRCCAGPAYWRSMAITRTQRRTPVPGPSIRSAVILTVTAQLLGLVLTVVGVWWQQRDIEVAGRVRFDRAVDRVRLEVRRRLEFPVFGLTGIRAAYAASDGVTRKRIPQFGANTGTSNSNFLACGRATS